jgi:hypothetical protein
MRKLFPFLMLFGLLLVTACDSDSNDSASDSDSLVGTWAVVGLTDASGDRSAGLAESYNAVLITLGADGAVNMAVDAKDAAASLSADGTYTVTEASKTIAVTLPVAPAPLTFDYDFVNATTLSLTPTPTTTLLLGVLFQTSYTDPVLFTFTKVS